MITVKIKCRNCHTILDNTKFTEEKQESCPCGNMMLDWHGHKIGGDFSLIDAMDDEKLQKEFIDLYCEYKKRDNACFKHLLAFRDDHEKEWDEWEKTNKYCVER